MERLGERQLHAGRYVSGQAATCPLEVNRETRLTMSRFDIVNLPTMVFLQQHKLEPSRLEQAVVAYREEFLIERGVNGQQFDDFSHCHGTPRRLFSCAFPYRLD